MSWRTWLFGEPKAREEFQRAMDLTGEVIQLVRDRSFQRDPMKLVLVEMIFHNHDPALIADAYEMSQEARIYKGAQRH